MQTMAPPTIRPANSADIVAACSVILRANEEFRGTVPDDFFTSYVASALDVAGRLEVAEVLVAEVDDRIVGTITFYDDANDEGAPTSFPPGTAGIRATAVDPGARRLGIGSALVAACIDRARASGADSIALHTAEFMRAAIATYEKAGFQRHPAFDFRTSAFFPSDPVNDLLAMAYVRSVR